MLQAYSMICFSLKLPPPTGLAFSQPVSLVQGYSALTLAALRISYALLKLSEQKLLRTAAYLIRQRARKCAECWFCRLMACFIINEVKAPRLATSYLPSLSKPSIPFLPGYYFRPGIADYIPFTPFYSSTNIHAGQVSRIAIIVRAC